MSAGAITGTTGTKELPEDDTILELTGGENPLTFLAMNAETIFGLIAGMSDPDRVEGWRQAEDELMDTDRDVVLEALERQRLCLERGDTPPIYHPHHDAYDEADDPLADANEGTGEANSEDTEEDAPEPGHEPHPEANLETGEVLVVDRAETTEYIWPARADADEPYILREMDDGDERQQIELPASVAYERVLNYDPDTRRADSVTVDAPLEAATNRGESA